MKQWIYYDSFVTLDVVSNLVINISYCHGYIYLFIYLCITINIFFQDCY